MLANFRTSIAERAAARRAPADWRKSRPSMSEAHLALIRKLPCCLCPERRGVQAHHLKSLSARAERGVGLKATDRWSTPLCWHHHGEIERIGSRNEPAYFASFGIDPHELANALWLATGDLARMGRVIIAHKQAAIRALRKQAVVWAFMRHGLTRAEAEEQYEAGLK